MKCQNCGEREANVRYTQIINGVKKEMALCEECSKKMGLDHFDFSMPINFSSFLGDFLDDTEEFFPSYNKGSMLKCPECGMTYEEFTHYGKLGCEKCSETFNKLLNSVLQNVHGTSKHNGRKYKNLIEGETINTSKKKEEITDEKQAELKKLKQEQAKAIEEERYEDAAKIRDEIKKLEK